MRYILGISIIDKDTKEVREGYARVDSLGLYPNLLTIEKAYEELEQDKEVKVIIYDNLEDVKKDIERFSKAFRREDVHRNDQIWQKSRKIRKFYPIKIDSSNFPFKVKETNLKTKNKAKIYRLQK